LREQRDSNFFQKNWEILFCLGRSYATLPTVLNKNIFRIRANIIWKKNKSQEKEKFFFYLDKCSLNHSIIGIPRISRWAVSVKRRRNKNKQDEEEIWQTYLLACRLWPAITARSLVGILPTIVLAKVQYPDYTLVLRECRRFWGINNPSKRPSRHHQPQVEPVGKHLRWARLSYTTEPRDITGRGVLPF